MTNAEPTPVFRRFPWIQLVFCLACLSMAGWTLARYSYCWAMSPEYLLRHSMAIERKAWPHSAYVVVRGVRVAGEGRAMVAYESGVCVDYADFEMGCYYNLYPRSMRLGDPYVLEEVSVVGRIDEEGACGTGSKGALAVMSPRIVEGAPRLTGASIAGLVAGAMGCVIFGLYLRTWLGDRKPLAQAPDQDMIA